jgi:hypothetical protein
MSSGRTIPPRLRTWALAAAAAAVTITTLGAQQDKKQSSQPIHIPLGAIHDAKEEARIRAGMDSSTRWLRVYRVETTPEVTLAYIRQDLGGGRGPRPDSAALRPGETSPITYTVAFHKFDDQCVDPPASPTAVSGTDPGCHVWRRGADKRQVLQNLRPIQEVGAWVETVVFTWYSRETNGDLIRLRVELRDTGLAPDWKHYMPRTQIIASTAAVGQRAP